MGPWRCAPCHGGRTVKVQWDPKVSLGSAISSFLGLVAICGSLIGGITAWNNLTATQAATSKEVGEIRAEVAARKAERDRQITEHESRLRAIEITQAGVSSDLRAIQTGISRIENTLERMQRP